MRSERCLTVCSFGWLDRPSGMRTRFRSKGHIRLLVVIIVLLLPLTLPAQQRTPRSPLRQAESEVWARLQQRARELGTLRLGLSDVDLVFPLEGEPTEVIGVMRLTNTSSVVATARLEPLDSIATRSDFFQNGRYDIRIEDRAGNCILVHQIVSIDTVLVRRTRTTEPCQPLYMAEVVRRSRRLARIPLNAGRLTDNWSMAPAITAVADIYLDSVVVTTTTLMLQANLREPETSVKVDSVIVGLALGEQSWSIVRKSRPLVVDTVLSRGEIWSRSPRRFVIPIDSTFALTSSWPVIEVSLSVPKTESNPYGFAWTYAHGPKDFFKDLRKQVER